MTLHNVTQAAVRAQRKVIKMVTQRLHKPQQKLSAAQDILCQKKVTRAAEAEPSSASTAPQNFEKIIKELNL